MMNQLIDRLHADHLSLVILHEGRVATYEGHGVYADYISEQAYDTLHAAGIKVTAVHKVSHHDFLKIWERMGETLDDNR